MSISSATYGLPRFSYDVSVAQQRLLGTGGIDGGQPIVQPPPNVMCVRADHSTRKLAGNYIPYSFRLQQYR